MKKEKKWAIIKGFISIFLIKYTYKKKGFLMKKMTISYIENNMNIPLFLGWLLTGVFVFSAIIFGNREINIEYLFLYLFILIMFLFLSFFMLIDLFKICSNWIVESLFEQNKMMETEPKTNKGVTNE